MAGVAGKAAGKHEKKPLNSSAGSCGLAGAVAAAASQNVESPKASAGSSGLAGVEGEAAGKRVEALQVHVVHVVDWQREPLTAEESAEVDEILKR